MKSLHSFTCQIQMHISVGVAAAAIINHDMIKSNAMQHSLFISVEEYRAGMHRILSKGDSGHWEWASIWDSHRGGTSCGNHMPAFCVPIRPVCLSSRPHCSLSLSYIGPGPLRSLRETQPHHRIRHIIYMCIYLHRQLHRPHCPASLSSGHSD